MSHFASSSGVEKYNIYMCVCVLNTYIHTASKCGGMTGRRRKIINPLTPSSDMGMIFQSNTQRRLCHEQAMVISH